jgi:hypothetical protein
MRYSILLLILASLIARADNPALKMKVIFSDDFEGAAVDQTKWKITAPQHVSIKKGKLVLGFGMTPTGPVGGGITIAAKPEQPYGYYEASIRFNAYKGHRGTMRISSTAEEIPGASITIQNKGADLVYPWARLASAGGTRDAASPKETGFLGGGKEAASKKFNTYGILWTEKAYTIYIGGKVAMKIDKPEVKTPMSFAIQHNALESDRKDFDPKTLPDDIEVDWVKIYK